MEKVISNHLELRDMSHRYDLDEDTIWLITVFSGTYAPIQQAFVIKKSTN